MKNGKARQDDSHRDRLLARRRSCQSAYARVINVGRHSGNVLFCNFRCLLARRACAILLQQVPVMMDRAHRLKTARLVKGLKQILKNAVAARDPIGPSRNLGNPFDRRVVRVAHQKHPPYCNPLQFAGRKMLRRMDPDVCLPHNHKVQRDR
jgi:hypothetical protein